MTFRHVRDGETERDCAARYLHSWANALRVNKMSQAESMLIDRMYQFAKDIRNGAHVADPDGTGSSRP